MVQIHPPQPKDCMKLGYSNLVEHLDRGSIRAYVSETRITRESLKIGPNSIDVSLHPKIYTPKCESRDAHLVGCVLDPYAYHNPDLYWTEHTASEENPFLLRTQTFALASVNERFECDQEHSTPDLDIAQMYEGRSTLARIGIASHLSAGFGDVGFSGAFTLELYNHSPWDILLRPGMRVGQVAFEYVIGVGKGEKYDGAYSMAEHKNGPVRPALGRERFIAPTAIPY